MTDSRVRLLRGALVVLLGVVGLATVGCGRSGSAQTGKESPPPGHPRPGGDQAASGRTRAAPGGSTIAQFTKSRFARVRAGLEDLPSYVLRPEPSATESRQLQDLSERLAKATDRAAFLAIVDEARDIRCSGVLGLVDGLLAAADPEVRGQAIGMLEGVTSPGILPLVAKVAADPDTDVRLEAVTVAAAMKRGEAMPILLKGMEDEDGNVRQTALCGALDLEPPHRIGALKVAAASPREDVAVAGLAFIEAEPNPDTVPAVLQALDHGSAAVRQQAHEIVALTFHQEFPTGVEALAWWEKNKGNYDENLVLLDAAATPEPEAP